MAGVIAGVLYKGAGLLIAGCFSVVISGIYTVWRGGGRGFIIIWRGITGV